MTPAKTTKSRKSFDELRKQIDADPARRANVEKHKTAMLGELRRRLDLTQAIVADRLDVTQENISQMSRTTPPLTVGSMLRSVWAELIDEVFEHLLSAGFEDLRPVDRPILRDLLVSNLRPSELATRLGLSKQAANDLVREFEAKGYIRLEPDPDDGRAKRIVATDRGWQVSETAQQSSNTVGRRWAELVGQERYAVFYEVLREIVAANGVSGTADHRDP